MADAAHLSPPAFEGSEKRLEVDFYAAPGGPGAPPAGLRTLPRSVLDDLMEQAACCIVSSRSNAHLDAYVLSESSLFVYPTRLVLKTCGTTRLLAAVPGMLAAAATVGLAPCRVKYSRASFLFPSAQPAPHHDFGAEAATLRQHFGHLGGAARTLRAPPPSPPPPASGPCCPAPTSTTSSSTRAATR